MNTLEQAIKQVEAEIGFLGAPAEGTPSWYVLRAKSTGLTVLKAALVRGMEDPTSFEAYRRQCRHVFANELGAE